VDGSDPLTLVERLFMEAGYSRTHYLFWRLSILSSLKTMSRMARLASGWPSDAIDEEAEELKLAKGWLEGEARRAAAAREKRAAEEQTSRSRDGTDAVFGPVMTTSEAKELIQQEIEGGRPVSLKPSRTRSDELPRPPETPQRTCRSSWAVNTRTGSWWSSGRNQAGTGRGTDCADWSPTLPLVATAGCDPKYGG
jgi:hypothetical protein